MLTLRGTYTALITPFSGDGLNEQALRELVDFQIANGISGLVPCGTTGESPTLSHDEHMRVIDIVVETADGRVPVIAGTGSNNTTEAIALTRHARSAGADAALMITPYYNRPSQAGVISHYRTVAEKCDLPVIVYNCPGRTSVNTTADTIVTLADVPTIVGVKEASGSIDQIGEIITRTPSDFTVLSGDDSMTVPMISIGAAGVISVTSNLLPKQMSEMVAAALAGEGLKARDMHSTLFPLMRMLMKAETNPSPIKAAMNLAGWDAGPVRLPLVPPPDPAMREIEKLMRELKVM